VITYLQKRWSPEQIAKKLRILYSDDMTMHVSHETIYAYVYVHPRQHLRRQLLFYLRRKHKYRRIRKVRQKTYPIQDYISIEDRPQEITDRKIPGHWEGDLIMGPGNRSALGTLVERTTRWLLLVKIKSHDATSVRHAFTHKFSHLPTRIKHSLTYDHGQEMAQHKAFTQRTKIQVYFAHPHSPWERGTSENTNMLVRDFFPRGTDFSKISSRELKKVQNLLNDRPHKTLNWNSPNEAFAQIVALEP
jgi:IS30 family transposase